MNKNEYLNSLKDKLISLDCQNVDEIIEKYSKRFELGYKASMSDEEIIDSLGSVDYIASLETINKVDNNESNSNTKIVDIDLELEYFANFEIRENDNADAINLEIDSEALEYVDFVKNNNEVSLKTKKEKKNVFINGFVNSRIEGKYHGCLLIGKNIGLNNVRIVSTSGELDIQIPLNVLNNVNVTTTSGDVSFKAINASEVKITSTSGNVKGNTINTLKGDLGINTTSGDIDIEAINCKETIKCNLTSANIEFKDVNCKGLTYNSTSGDVEIETIKADEKIVINTVSGDVIIRHSDCNAYNMNTVSGDITIQSSDNENPSVSSASVSGEITFCGKVRGNFADSIKNAFSSFTNKKNKY